jgi:transcriptional regulator with GAF, ATPase, and Fis domain
VVETARRIAHADSPVLLLGETGVGKERLARMIHADSSRAPGAFIAVNCAAIPGELFESELFGHEKGAFTGASRSRRGQFELAHGGTLFLDEVGEVPVHLQAKLLRALQERKVKPVGSNHAVEIDVRVISATNRDLAEEMTEGRFRRDLYYRLSVVELTIPPLRERAEDIRVMTDAFVRALAAQLGRQVEGFDPPALHALEHYDWPGNVRELVNVIERAVLLCDAPRIGLGDLPEAVTRCASEELAPPVSPLGSGPDVVSVPPAWAAQTWKHVREELLLAGERAYLCAVLAAAEGRVGLAASRAGLSPRALFEKMRRHGLRKEDFRPTRPSAT